MKKLILITCLSLAAAFKSPAATPSYSNKNAGGNGTSGAEVIFPADPQGQIRLVSVQWQSDTNTGALEFQTAVGAYTASYTNRSTTDTTQCVSSTSGLVTNTWLVLQHLGVCYKALLVATNSGTNAILGSGGWGVISSVNDAVYPLSTTNTISVGATTNWQNGEALFVGNLGRPVRVQLTPALTTNRLNSVTARYE